MALYNNGYPMSYPQMYMPNSAPSMPQQSGVIWVQGEAGAKSYLVAPNTTIALFDSESQTIYLKSADASGIPSIKTLDYTIRNAAQAFPAGQEYATKSEVNQLAQSLSELSKKFGEFSKEAV